MTSKKCSKCLHTRTSDLFVGKSDGRVNKTCRLCLDLQMGHRCRAPLRVPAKPFQDAFQRSMLTKSEVARRMGYVRTVRSQYKHPDGRVTVYPKRYFVPDSSPIRRILSQKTLNYQTAIRFCSALNLDPVDLGV